MSLTPDDIRAIIAEFEASDWSELSLQHGETLLQMSRTGTPPATATAASGPAPVLSPPPVAPAVDTPAPAAADPVASTPTVPSTTEGFAVLAPTLGLFWCSPQPGAPPFVEIGQHVGADDTVCIVEVMKLMSHVKAGVAGTVIAVPVENGAMVEHGDTLVVIAPES